jgi:hypothetical protein
MNLSKHILGVCAWARARAHTHTHTHTINIRYLICFKLLASSYQNAHYDALTVVSEKDGNMFQGQKP